MLQNIQDRGSDGEYLYFNECDSQSQDLISSAIDNDKKKAAKAFEPADADRAEALRVFGIITEDQYWRWVESLKVFDGFNAWLRSSPWSEEILESWRYEVICRGTHLISLQKLRIHLVTASCEKGFNWGLLINIIVSDCAVSDVFRMARHGESGKRMNQLSMCCLGFPSDRMGA